MTQHHYLPCPCPLDVYCPLMPSQPPLAILLTCSCFLTLIVIVAIVSPFSSPPLLHCLAYSPHNPAICPAIAISLTCSSPSQFLIFYLLFPVNFGLLNLLFIYLFIYLLCPHSPHYSYLSTLALAFTPLAVASHLASHLLQPISY